jgi:hypothetical protein
MGLPSTLGLLFEMNGDPTKALAAMAQLDAASVASSTKVSTLWSDAMNTISGPTGIALGLFTGLGGAALDMASKWADAGNQIYEASEKTGMSAEALSGVLALSKETGKSFEGVANVFARGERAIAQAADTGKGALTSLFSQAQLQALKLKPVDEQIQTVLHSIFALSNQGERNRQLQALLGRGWMENVSVLKLLATEGYGPASEQAKKLNLNFDEKSAREAHDYTIQMHQLSAELSGLGLIVGREVVKPLSNWLAQLHTIPYEIELLRIGLKAQATSMLNVGGVLDKQLDNLAKRATDVWVAEHLALQKYAADIASLAAGAAAGAEGGPLGQAAAATGKAAAATRDYAEAADKLRVVLPPVIEEMQRIEKSKADQVIKKQALALLDYGKNFQPLASGPLSVPNFNVALDQNLGLFEKLPPYVEQTAVSEGVFAHAVYVATQALHSEVAAQAESLAAHTASLLGKLGLRRAEAVVETVVETAKAFSDLGDFNFWGAAQHFESAAEWGIVAGTSARRGGAGAGPGGGYRARGEGGGYERGEYGGAGGAPPGFGLAPGAQQNTGGRLNVYVIGDEAAFIAQRVNEADRAGHFMQVTSSRRSAPAQG